MTNLYHVSPAVRAIETIDQVCTDPAAWFHISNVDKVASLAHLFLPERIETNLRRMLALARGPQRLFPHIKTHKLPALVRRQQVHGTRQFKCATIAEAEMAANCGAERMLLSHQPVGLNVGRVLELVVRFPGTCVLMDATYAEMMPEAGFQYAAVVLTRVISKPEANRLGLDLGHKAIASEGPHPCVQVFALLVAVAVGHNGQHKIPRATDFAVGDTPLGIPRLVRPTVALHDAVMVVEAGRVVSS